MPELEGGIVRDDDGDQGVVWNFMNQTYHMKALCDTSFAFDIHAGPGDHVPVHVHKNQDEFIWVLDGELSLKLDGEWSVAKPGDFVKLPKGVPHGYFNKSDQPVRALFWVSPPGRLKELFDRLDEMEDPQPDEVVRVSAEHEVDFLPPEAND